MPCAHNNKFVIIEQEKIVLQKDILKAGLDLHRLWFDSASGYQNQTMPRLERDISLGDHRFAVFTMSLGYWITAWSSLFWKRDKSFKEGLLGFFSSASHFWTVKYLYWEQVQKLPDGVNSCPWSACLACGRPRADQGVDGILSCLRPYRIEPLWTQACLKIT